MNADDWQREMDKLEARDKADVAEAVQLLRDIRDAVRELKPVQPDQRMRDECAEFRDRMIAAERKLLDYEGKEMPYSGRTRLAQAEAENVVAREQMAELERFRAREPLVEKVLNWNIVGYEEFQKALAAVRNFKVAGDD